MCLACPCRGPCASWRLQATLHTRVNANGLVECVRHSRLRGNDGNGGVVAGNRGIVEPACGDPQRDRAGRPAYRRELVAAT